MVIAEDYYNEEIEVKLTKFQIESIIDSLEAQPHNIYEFMNLKEIINKLKEAKDGKEN